MAININNNVIAKPFLKWAGGKTQLLPVIDHYLPAEVKSGKIKRYIEPFVGSGAVLFFIIQKYMIEEAMIWDINPELMLVYEVIKKDVNELILLLEKKENEYLKLNNEERKHYYYNERQKFNEALSNFDFESYGIHKIIRASQFIFLNRTCFNGLFRVNKSGYFNVPMGAYKNPIICHKENLIAVHQILQKVIIRTGDYRQCRDYVNNETFVYFDPPYKPISESSSFTSYSKFEFGDEEQKELANYFKELNNYGAKLMLSNSDPRNVDPDNDFFEREELYGSEGIFIHRVSARRSINSKAGGRGEINELLITNYKTEQN